MPPPTPSSHAKEAKLSEVSAVSTLIDETFRPILESDDESDYEADDNSNKTNERPKVDDVFLKNYARLVSSLDELIFSIDSPNEEDMSVTVNKCLEFEDDKIKRSKQELTDVIRSEMYLINKTRPLTWSLIYDLTSRKKTNRIYNQIRQNQKRLKKSVNLLFENISSNSLGDNREDIINELKALIKLQGEYTFMNAQILNTHLNRNSATLEIIEKEYMTEYANGVDNQYQIYLHNQMEYFNEKEVPMNNFIQNMEDFRSSCKNFKTSDTRYIIDFCNYAFQSHYNLMSVVKILKREERSASFTLKTSMQIDYFLRTILADSKILRNTPKIVNSEKSNIEEWLLSHEKILKFYKERK